MSYARFSDESNVYMYHHYQGFIECCGCWISDEIPDGYEDIPSPRFKTARRAIRHLMEHIEKGYKVPDRVFDRIYEEYEGHMDDPIEPFVSTEEQEARQKARLDRLRQMWKEDLAANE